MAFANPIPLKELRLLGMVSAWTDLLAQGESQIAASKWLIEHLLQAEHTDRAMRSISHQMKVARFPIHRDLAGFDFACESAAQIDESQIGKLATLEFVDTAQNVVFIGGPGSGKTHLATAIGVAGITKRGLRVRFYCTVDLVNALEAEKAQGKAGRIAQSLLRMDLVILDLCGVTSSDTCRSARPVAPCCSTCCPSCTSTPAWRSPPT